MEMVQTRCVCTSLRMATRSAARAYDSALANVGLRQIGYTILSRIDADGPMSIVELASRLCLDRSTCSRELAPLLAAGLVDFEAGEDRRRRVHRLSPAGAELLARARPHWRRVQEEIESVLGDVATERLLDSLRDVLQRTETMQSKDDSERAPAR